MPHTSRRWITYRDNKYNKYCTVCDKEFRGAVSFKLHVKTAHPEATIGREDGEHRTTLTCTVCRAQMTPGRRSCSRCTGA